MTGAARGSAQAFPIARDDENTRVLGMTLRDYFAAKALQGIIGNEKALARVVDNYDGPAPQGLAIYVFKIADAMLRESAK